MQSGEQGMESNLLERIRQEERDEVVQSLAVRDIGEEDIEAVLVLWDETGLSEGWHDQQGDIAFSMKSENSTILVAAVGGDVVGTLMVGHDGHWGWLYYLGVVDSWRALGLGQCLLEEGESWLRERGLRKVNLLVHDDSVSGLKDYYERMSYYRYPTMHMQKLL